MFTFQTIVGGLILFLIFSFTASASAARKRNDHALSVFRLLNAIVLSILWLGVIVTDK